MNECSQKMFNFTSIETNAVLFFKNFIIIILAVLHGLWDLSSPSRD